jgi:DNA-binding MarR family transcriptional regulator
MSLEEQTQPPMLKVGPNRGWLTPKEMRTWLSFWGVAHLIDVALDHDLRAESSLSHNDYQILAMLSNAPEHRLRMSELADRVFGSRSRLTYQVTQLEKAGLVRREGCLTDKRGAVAVLTEQGQGLLNVIAPGHVESIRRVFFDVLTPEQVNLLGEALHSVIKGLEGGGALECVLERELNRTDDNV